MKVVEFEATPNPNAIKCWLDGRASAGPRSYFNAEAAQGDPLARSLFAIPGVTNVLILGDWITVSKGPQTPWPAVKNAIRRALEAHAP